jgi:hypothetical protein
MHDRTPDDSKVPVDRRGHLRPTSADDRGHVQALLRLQRLAGNQATAALLTSQAASGPLEVPIQRTLAAARRHTPDNAAHAVHPTFRAHHTAHGQPFDSTVNRDAVAIANHTSRANNGLNTTVDMSADDCRREIFRYLEDLGVAESAALPAAITFTTRGTYPFVTTTWNHGNPTPVQYESGRARVRMQRTAGDYYQIYHLDGMEPP